MVSSTHEAMHRIFQEDPGVFARTFRALGIPFEDQVTATLLPTDLTETKPLERRVDTLLRFDSEAGNSFLLAVEAQGKKDSEKEANWTYYLAHLYAKYRLPPILLVVCQDRNTARWAKRPVRVGTPQWTSLTMHPLVLGPHNVPLVTDPVKAAEDVPLATLSAITHGRDPNATAILKALASALKTLNEETASIFIELTELGLGNAPAAQTWRKIMAVDLDFFRSETSQRLRAEGRAGAILLLLSQRDVTVPDDVRDRINDCPDLDTLDTWFTRAITATTVDEIFQDQDH